MGGREVSLRYCNGAGDEVTTTWREARADLIVEGLPVRIPPSYRGQGHYPGLFWSATNQRTLVYESLLELDRLWLADFDQTVVGIATQPFQITGSGAGAQPSHVPDVLLVHTDRAVTLVDVKPTEFLERPEVRTQFDWTRGLCRDKGWRYEVFSGGDPVVLRNIRALAVGRRPERLPGGVLDQARAVLAPGDVTLSEAVGRKPATCEDVSWHVAILGCLWRGEAWADLRRPLGTNTVLTRAAVVPV
ncbi:TnsA-like heteromeric transposase endonuclease subunit [Ornithinimicrobium faecis]|uniref:TnsA-like heteromeric transposase endonuclease subunit n=1 Tax=Ornithinimicrobium faecis TaxID=2934158 RepID=A0ABY4YTC5_9MICO|nr:TnsA-like heteromeric transposase endonuclease subunit [Ornithinimicrobium sp. HY1793]USQ79725.1 TnsA-like heteromeric transposase endonuclease subunit [Ornithinimicrobium sp. HY1793]